MNRVEAALRRIASELDSRQARWALIGGFAVSVGLAQANGLSTTPEIKDAAVVLGRTVDGSQDAWRLGLDTFAGRCLDRGFKAV